MGSTGSGHFSDYSGYKDRSGESNNGDQNKGGSSGEDMCSRAFSTQLDEVSICDYFINNSNVPPEGTRVKIVFVERLNVIDSDHTCIGYLPTKYNYIRACMADGHEYSGVISESSLTPIPRITIDIAPSHE